MAADMAVQTVSEGSIQLMHAPDKDIAFESAENNTVQVMQINLARDIVRDMRKCARRGQPMSIGFGKHLVNLPTIVLAVLLYVL